MWSDRATQQEHEALVARLRSMLPAPSPQAGSLRQTLDIDASLHQVAAYCSGESGLQWLQGEPGPTLLRDPLVTITYRGMGMVGGRQGGAATIRVDGQQIELQTRAFDLVEAMLQAWGGPSAALLAGFLSYDLAAELEDIGTLPQDGLGFPSLHFALYDAALRYREGIWTLEATDAWRDQEQAIHQAHNALHQALQLKRAAPEVGVTGEIESSPDQAGFERSVGSIVAAIHQGDYFQTNLCRSLATDLQSPFAWKLFRRMREISPARYEAFIRLSEKGPEEVAVASISPELFLKLDGPPEARIAESQPIKGTRPRGATPEQDRALIEELLSSEKDRAELAMIVDVVRNDLSRVCMPGTVEVTEHAAHMELPTVHHSVSTVRGRLREGEDAASLLRAAFPAASISGAPKIAAIKAAYEQEQQLRGPAMGAIGWISMDGRMEMSVAIRTAFVSGNKVRYYAGCGITAESDPASEFAESEHKAAAFLRALAK